MNKGKSLFVAIRYNVEGQRRLNMNERNWFHRSIFNSSKKGLVLIRYKLGITPKEILFIDQKGKEKRERRYEMRIELRARVYTPRCRWSQYCRPSQARSSQVVQDATVMPDPGVAPVRGYPALCISFSSNPPAARRGNTASLPGKFHRLIFRVRR